MVREKPQDLTAMNTLESEGTGVKDDSWPLSLMDCSAVVLITAVESGGEMPREVIK